MASQKTTKTSQIDKLNTSNHSEMLTRSEMQSLMQDFYETAVAMKMENAEGYLNPIFLQGLKD